MKVFSLVNPNWAISEVDIVINTPIDYKEAEKKVNYISLQNIPIPIISIDDLIRMKQKTGRDQDKADIKYLKKIKNEKR